MTPHGNDPFFLVPRHAVGTSEGEVELPILYFDVSTVAAFFLVERSRVESALEKAGLQPGLGFGGRVLAGLALYEYRHTTIGPYNEVGLAVSVAPRGANLRTADWLSLWRDPQMQTAGFHILDLPVTTAIACTAGRELWGFPKFVTEIGFDLGRDRFHGSVADPDGAEPILTLEGSLGSGVPAPPPNLLLYSRRNDESLRSVVNVRGRVQLGTGRELRLGVGASSHRMAETLRDLGLDGARPAGILWTDRFQSRLNAAAPILGEVPAPR